MNCSLNCFCDFLEATTAERRASVIKKYKKGSSAPVKGMVNYYRPALRAMRGRLCPEGSLSDKLTALKNACVIASWPAKLNEARMEANTAAYKAFRSEFGNKQLKIFSNPRLQYLASTEVAVNLQPELYAEVDGITMMWKFGMTKKSRSENTIRTILQMMSRASQHKGFAIPIQQFRFFDIRTGMVSVEFASDVALERNWVQSSLRSQMHGLKLRKMGRVSLLAFNKEAILCYPNEVFQKYVSYQCVEVAFSKPRIDCADPYTPTINTGRW